nr:MAG: replication associated protein [Cressdnaviricota sp.]
MSRKLKRSNAQYINDSDLELPSTQEDNSIDENEENTAIRSSGRRIILSNADPKKKKEFRFCSSSVFLTFPQCELPKSALIDLFKERGAIIWIVASENHKNGDPHLHGFAKFKTELDSRQVTYWDLKGVDKVYHPNIRNPEIKKNYEGAIHYCMKDGDWEADNVNLFLSPDKFVQKQRDLVAWQEHIAQKKMKDPVYPILLPDEKGSLINKPSARDKKRHWIIVARPDWGKTHWANDAFEDTKIYCPLQNGDLPFDAYDNEELILFDDYNFKDDREGQAMLIDISNVTTFKKPVYGRTRYHPKFWKTHQARVIIILCNYIPFMWKECEWFTSRFNVLDVHEQQPYETPAARRDQEACGADARSGTGK